VWCAGMLGASAWDKVERNWQRRRSPPQNGTTPLQRDVRYTTPHPHTHTHKGPSVVQPCFYAHAHPPINTHPPACLNVKRLLIAPTVQFNLLVILAASGNYISTNYTHTHTHKQEAVGKTDRLSDNGQLQPAPTSSN
jgi:hypothetical protein